MQPGSKVYADAVFNQLASGTGTATGGGSYNSGQYQYPQFGYNDFHHSGDITNYGDSNNVWNGASTACRTSTPAPPTCRIRSPPT